VVADQLGHINPVMVNKVYGVYAPGGSERDYWEKRAATRDEEEELIAPTASRAKRHEKTRRKPSRAPQPSRNAGHTPKIVWPAVEALLSRLESHSVVSVAKDLGVSDQALRKHLKARGVTQIPDGRRARAASRR
jgi:hypothetical protein